MIPQIGDVTGSAVPLAQRPDSLGKDAFLNLLVTQLKHQDPLEPMGGTEFVAQLAQFSELDEMRQMTGGQEALERYMASLNNFAAVSLLGKEVEFPGNRVVLQEGVPSTIRFDLARDASQVTVEVYDEEGRLVDTILEGGMPAGVHGVSWDGTGESGQPLLPGTYRCTVLAKDDRGQEVPVSLIQDGRVQEVGFQDGVPVVYVNDRWVPLSEIRAIRPGPGG